MQHLNSNEQESKQESTPVTLEQSQGHQTYQKNVDSEQGCNHAKFERSRFNSV